MVDSISNLGLTGVGGVKATGTSSGADGTTASGASFKDVLLQSLGEVNKLQADADTKLENYQTGKTANVGEVVAATQKASAAFSLLVQIRNKLQDAYDEVKNLRV